MKKYLQLQIQKAFETAIQAGGEDFIYNNNKVGRGIFEAMSSPNTFSDGGFEDYETCTLEVAKTSFPSGLQLDSLVTLKNKQFKVRGVEIEGEFSYKYNLYFHNVV